MVSLSRGRTGAVSETVDEKRYGEEKDALVAYVKGAVDGIADPREARARAKELIDEYQARTQGEIEQASKTMLLLQRVEFVIGALVVVTVIVSWFRDSMAEPFSIVLVGILVVAYVATVLRESTVKRKRRDLYYQSLAAKKSKLKTTDDTLLVEFD
jgi:F0F1-type ATP synthase assembly protein I